MDFQKLKRVCMGLVCALPALLTGTADAMDTDVYLSRTGTVPPNVVFSIDTSGSMANNYINIPRDYDPSGNYLGPFGNDRAYISVDGRIPSSTDGLSATSLRNARHCDFAHRAIRRDGFVAVRAAVSFSERATDLNYARKVWFPANRVRFETFGSGAVRVECQDDAGVHGGGGSANYASKIPGRLYTSRQEEEIDWEKYPFVVIFSGRYLNYKVNPGPFISAQRAYLQERVVKDAIKRTPEVFAGLAVFDDKLIPGGDWWRNEDYIYYGAIRSAVKDNSVRANQNQLLAAVDSSVYNNATPLGTALLEILHYYHGKSPLIAPWYATDPESVQGGNYKSPITSACQKNYVLFVTDGSPYNDVEAARNFVHPSSNYPEYQSILGSDKDACDGNCLDEIAQYLSVADADPAGEGEEENNLYDLDGDGSPDPQTVKVFPVGMEIEEPLLKQAAEAAGTRAYYATSAVKFENAIVDILATIKLQQGASMVTATSSVDGYSKVSNRNFLYYGMFSPTSNFQWKGNLKKYRIAYTNSGDGNPHNDVAYVTDQSSDNPPVATDTGQIIPEARSYWSTRADGNNALVGGVLDRLKVATGRTMSGINNWWTGRQRVFRPANELALNNHFFSNWLGAKDRSDAERTAILNYALGEDVHDEDQDGDTAEQRGHLGAIVRSGPVTVQYGSADGSSPVIVVYAVTTDGVLHAFDDQTGDEIWSVMMTDTYGELVEQFDNHGTFAPWWGIDGGITPHVVDKNANGIIEDGDKVYLLINTGLGLRKWIALDVSKAHAGTNQIRVMARSEGPMDTSKDPAVPNAGWEEFGLATARAVPITYRLAGDDDGTKRSAFLYANGFDPIAEFSYGENTVGRGLTLHESDESKLRSFGNILWRATRSTGGYASMEFAFPTTPTTIDVDGDGIVDLFYAVDVNAQLWRFHRNAGARTVADLFSGGILARLGRDADGERRRSYKRVDAAMVNGGEGPMVLLAIGTGDRMNPLSDTETDRLHVIMDRTAMSGSTPSDIITASDMYNATSNDMGDGSDEEKAIAAESLNASAGWYIDLPKGQKAISAPLISSGIANFPVYRPAIGTAAECENSGLGSGLLYRVNVLTAEPVTDLSGDGILNGEDRFTVLHAAGIPGDMVSHVSSSGVKTLFSNLQGIVDDPEALNPNSPSESGSVFSGGPAGYWFEGERR